MRGCLVAGVCGKNLAPLVAVWAAFAAWSNERTVFVELDMSAGVEVVAIVVARFIENDGGKADARAVCLGAGDFGCGFVVELERERCLKIIAFPMGENRADC